jgi:hypothetical protein
VFPCQEIVVIAFTLLKNLNFCRAVRGPGMLLAERVGPLFFTFPAPQAAEPNSEKKYGPTPSREP